MVFTPTMMSLARKSVPIVALYAPVYEAWTYWFMREVLPTLRPSATTLRQRPHGMLAATPRAQHQCYMHHVVMGAVLAVNVPTVPQHDYFSHDSSDRGHGWVLVVAWHGIVSCTGLLCDVVRSKTIQCPPRGA